MVLDDAVVDDGEAVRDMRVGVTLTRRTVGGPAGVGNTGFTGQLLILGFCRQVGDTTGGTDTNKIITVKDSDAGRVITPVFELAQAFEQNTNDVFMSYRRDNTAHESDSNVINSLCDYTGRCHQPRDISL